MNDYIVVKGARVHNLKNVTVEIPRNKFVVITGLSGSGKSSLAFDTIYAEGQRRYVESLSAYARQFLGLMDKPDVDQIEGLSPAISIDQKSVSHNPRSTVGTVTEIYDYLRLLYARIGIPHCPQCGRVVERQTPDQILEKLLEIGRATRSRGSTGGVQITLFGPIIRGKKGEHKQVLQESQRSGFSRVLFDGVLVSIVEALDYTVDRQKKHDISILVDSLTVQPTLDPVRSRSSLATADSSTIRASNGVDADTRTRLFKAIESGLDLGDGLLIVRVGNEEKDILFSQNYSCPVCDISLPELEPRLFSFNSPHGACPACTGLGTQLHVEPDLVIPNKNLTIAEGAIRPWSRTGTTSNWFSKILEAVGVEHGFSSNTPLREFTKKQLEVLFYGTGARKYNVGYESYSFSGDLSTQYEGVIPNLERRYKETDSEYIRTEIEKYMRVTPCPVCEGKRLKPEALGVTVADKAINYVVSLPINEAFDFVSGLSKGKSLTGKQQIIAKQVLKEINERLHFLQNVGLSYLTLDRSASTLSGGESQRIRLATQIGSQLTGVLYILDEPSIGLHQRDNQKLIETLRQLQKIGNSVIVVEHDEDTIRAADWVIDVGPGAGEHGGRIVAEGEVRDLVKVKQSLTGQYLKGALSIPVPKTTRKGNGKTLSVVGATENNLKNLTVSVPLGKFVVISGVSGSGKSTLVSDILSKALLQHYYQAKEAPGKHKEIKGLEHLDKAIIVDQSPIGRTPRSNPATYTGVFTVVRDLFTQVPEAKIRGYDAGRFSFNVKGGRCEACQGDGLVRIEMNFLPDVYVECEECHGKRYNREALEIHYAGKNISDVLNMNVEEAQKFFSAVPALKDKLDTLMEVGLGYMKLGQSATTLSGGEAQRIKLATELARKSTGKTLYILDEPTTGLHFDDVKRLLGVLQRLVDKGNTVLVVEHNLDVIKCADWIIDMGPEGGDKGGEIVAQGTPKDVEKVKQSYTGQFLKKMKIVK